jgi:ribosomal-protein-alanine N-acetyltransferase
MEIRRVRDVVDVMAASSLFDGPAREDWAARFLGAPNHHLLVAYVDGVPAGMVTGAEVTMPDKGTEMFLYELGVAEPYRRRGVGRALVDALVEVAVAARCYGMWVLTDDDNDAALATYRSGGAGEPEPCVLLPWTFRT